MKCDALKQEREMRESERVRESFKRVFDAQIGKKHGNAELSPEPRLSNRKKNYAGLCTCINLKKPYLLG